MSSPLLLFENLVGGSPPPLPSPSRKEWVDTDIWHAGLHRLKPYGFSGQTFDLMSCFLSNKQLQVVLNRKSSYPVNAGVPQASILGSTLYLLYIYDLPDGVICDIVICADDTTLYSMCNQAYDLATTGIGF